MPIASNVDVNDRDAGTGTDSLVIQTAAEGRRSRAESPSAEVSLLPAEKQREGQNRD